MAWLNVTREGNAVRKARNKKTLRKYQESTKQKQLFIKLEARVMKFYFYQNTIYNHNHLQTFSEEIVIFRSAEYFYKCTEFLLFIF